MLLSHYCRDQQDSGFPVAHYDGLSDNEHKPGGLWVGDEESGQGWKTFALEMRQKQPEQWQFHPEFGDIKDDLRFRYDFRIRPEQSTQILAIRSLRDLYWFTEEFKEESPRPCVVDAVASFGVHIDWKTVKGIYKGILITPYHTGARETDPVRFHWYRFDCASGCFWDTSCLEMVGWRGPLHYD